MGMKRLTPVSQIDDFVQSKIERLERLIIRNLAYVGETCVNVARDTNSYKDQTANLRSSIGYILIKNGEVIQMSSFQKEKDKDGNIGGDAGVLEGPKFAKSLIKNFPQGIVLVVVAGMNYAHHVASNGYDVLDSAQLVAEKLVPEIMKNLGFK